MVVAAQMGTTVAAGRSRAVPANEARVCPFIGQHGDRATRFLMPDLLHRCWVGRQPARVDFDYQGRFCLTDRYLVCPLFVAARTAADAAQVSRVVGIGKPLKLRKVNELLAATIVVLLAAIGIVMLAARAVT